MASGKQLIIERILRDRAGIWDQIIAERDLPKLILPAKRSWPLPSSSDACASGRPSAHGTRGRFRLAEAAVPLQRQDHP